MRPGKWFDAASLHSLIAGAEGRDLTLPELNTWVSRITDFYHACGYPLARALIPAQTIRDGVVSIAVIETRYGKILFDNQSRVRDALLDATLAPLKSGQTISQADLDHALLLLDVSALSGDGGVQTSAEWRRNGRRPARSRCVRLITTING